MSETPSQLEGSPGGTPPNPRLMLLYNQFNKLYEYNRQDRERLLRNCRMSWGVDYAQWPKFIVDRLLSQGRQAPTFNIIDRNITGLAGTLLRNKFDMKFQSLAASEDFSSSKLNNMWISDQSQMNWERSDAELMTYGLIQQGTQVMTVEDPTGTGDYHIGFRTIPPWNVMYDSNWRSIYPKDCDMAWTWTYMTVNQIIQTFDSKSEEILAEKNRQSIEGYDPGEFEGAVPEWIDHYPDTNSRWGDKHRVIEFHEMRYSEDYAEYDLKNSRFMPEGNFQEKLQYAQENDLGDDDIRWVTRKKKEYWKTVFAPGLSKHVLLEETKHYLQVDRLPLFPWGARRMNGQWKGVVDDLYDLQMDINKNEMAMTEFLQRCTAGSFIAHPDLVGNDHSKMKTFEQNLSTPGAILWADENADSINGLIEPTPRPSIPGELIGNTDRKYGLVDRLGLQTAAAEGRAESGRESGRLFQSKFEAGVIAQTLINLGLKNHLHDKAEAYFLQAPITYAGREREFPGSEEVEPFRINEMVAKPNGEIGKKNDITKMKRQKIVITSSPKGLNMRSKAKEVMSDIYQANQNDPYISALAMKYIIKSEDLPEESKQEILEGLNLSIEIYKNAKIMELSDIKSKMGQMGQQDPMGMPNQAPPGEGGSLDMPQGAVDAAGTPDESALNSGGAADIKEIMNRNQP